MIDLRQGNCLELMKDIPDKSIDMILCDLPYGTTRNKWDSVIPLDKLWEQYSRIIKDNGAIVLFSQMSFTAELVHSNLNLFKYEWIWQKENGTGFLNAKKMPLKIHENIEIFYKKTPTYNPQMRKGFKPYSQMSGRGSSNYGEQIRVQTINNGERYPIDIIEFKRDKEKLHSTQKPVALLEYLIKTYTNENETVLDNCAGSMSTVIASTNTNRNCIAIEKDKNYFEIGKKRVIEHLKTNNISANLVIFDNECAI